VIALSALRTHAAQTPLPIPEIGCAPLLRHAYSTLMTLISFFRKPPVEIPFSQKFDPPGPINFLSSTFQDNSFQASPSSILR
jgi:hypothetical protein